MFDVVTYTAVQRNMIYNHRRRVRREQFLSAHQTPYEAASGAGAGRHGLRCHEIAAAVAKISNAYCSITLQIVGTTMFPRLSSGWGKTVLKSRHTDLSFHALGQMRGHNGRFQICFLPIRVQIGIGDCHENWPNSIVLELIWGPRQVRCFSCSLKRDIEF